MMEFDKVVLEGKKYQDLVKLAKEHDLYRRYAPKAELIERLLDLNNETPQGGETSLLSDVSMPSMNISGGELADESHRASKNEDEKVKGTEKAARRSVLSAVNEIISPALPRRRKTVAFITPEQRTSPAKRFTRVSTPAKPLKTPTRKSGRKSSIATSTPASKVTRKIEARVKESQLNELDCTFTIQDENIISHMQTESPVPLRREGTFDIITVDNDGCEVPADFGEQESPWNGNRSKRSRSSLLTSQSKTHGNLSVKELQKKFEPEIETSCRKEKSAGLSRSCRWSNVSPHLKAKSTRTSNLRASLRKSGRKSDVQVSANISLPSMARQAQVTSRAKPEVKPSTTKILSILKTPKLETPSVAKEIELKQLAVSAKKMMGATSATKSKIPPPRKVPNFNEIHAKMFSKMESLSEDKQKVLHRAQEYGNSAYPRCAVATPKVLTAEKSQKAVGKDHSVVPRPVAARQLKLPEKSKIPGRAVDAADCAVSVGVVPSSLNVKLSSKRVDTSSKLAEKSEKSTRNFLPANCLISRLPVLVSSQTTSRPGNLNDGKNTASSQNQRAKETIITKAPVIKIQDTKSKNRKLLQNVRTNKRFELQMQHRMKCRA